MTLFLIAGFVAALVAVALVSTAHRAHAKGPTRRRGRPFVSHPLRPNGFRWKDAS